MLTRLGQVVVDRTPNLLDQGVGGSGQDAAGDCGIVLSFRGPLSGHPDAALELLGVLAAQGHTRHQLLGEVVAPGGQDAHETGDPATHDGDLRHRCPDVEQSLGLRSATEQVGAERGPNQAESLEVYRENTQPGTTGDADQALDHLPLGGHHENRKHRVALRSGVLLERHEVENRLLHRDRDGVLDLIGKGLT